MVDHNDNLPRSHRWPVPPERCTLYLRGHRIHYIQARKATEDREGHVRAQVVGFGASSVRIEMPDGQVRRHWVHDVDAVREAVVRHGSEVTVQSRSSLMAFEIAGGRRLFSWVRGIGAARVRPRPACRSVCGCRERVAMDVIRLTLSQARDLRDLLYELHRAARNGDEGEALEEIQMNLQDAWRLAEYVSTGLLAAVPDELLPTAAEQGLVDCGRKWTLRGCSITPRMDIDAALGPKCGPSTLTRRYGRSSVGRSWPCPTSRSPWPCCAGSGFERGGPRLAAFRPNWADPVRRLMGCTR